MPLVRLLRDSVVGQAVLPAGRVVDMLPPAAERFVKAGKGLVVPAGTESDADADPDHETADARPTGERAALRGGKR